MEGEEVIVELKNGRQIEGILQTMEDPSMSVTLALSQSHSLTSTTTMPSQSTTTSTNDSTMTTTTTDTTSSPVVALHHNRICHIRGSCIRYIHLPNDFVSILRTQQDRERTARQRYQRGIRKT